MKAFFTQLNSIEMFYLVCAVVGGLFVFIRLVTQLAGMDHGASGDIDTGGRDFGAHHQDSDVGFKLLSLQGISSFFMMFGLVGLAMYKQSKMGGFISTVAAIAGGLASVWVIKKIFTLIMALQSSGTIAIESTVGSTGKVYLAIPKNGTGRVLINVKNSLREYDASSNDGSEIETDIPVRVVWVDGNVLVVERI